MSDARLPINHGDTGKVSRDKINDSFNDLVTTVEGYRPHIESGIWWIGDTNTGVKAQGDNVEMKVEDGYIWYKSSSVNQWTQIIAIADLKGDKGDTGDAATVCVGNVSTGDPGTDVCVTNSGTQYAAVLNFTIPRGATGCQGDTGASICAATFCGDDMVFTKDDGCQVVLCDAKDELKGDTGRAATVAVGCVTTGEPGTSVCIVNTGTCCDAILDFTIPQGIKGDRGNAATITVGNTTTGDAGTCACVTNSGTCCDAVLNFTIPKGAKGDTGDTGARIVSAEFSENDIVFTEDNCCTVTLCDAKTCLKGDKGDTGDTGARIVCAEFSDDDIVFTEDNSCTVTLCNAKTCLKGDKGDTGAAATVTVGTTCTGGAGTSASVVNSGTSCDAVFDFTIPKGDQGDKGETGASIVSAAFSDDDIVFTKDDSCTVTLCDAKTCLKGDKGDQGNPGETGNGICCVTCEKSGKTTTITMNYTSGEPTVFQVQDGADGSGSGDMCTCTYDPSGCMSDAFNYCNFYNTPTIPTDNCQLANSCGYTTCVGTVVADDLTPYAKSCDLCTVSTSGKYCDLTGTPTIPTDNCQLANSCGFTTCIGTVVAADLTPFAKSCTLCTVATSGKYCDLTGQPTIPTDNCQLANSCGYTTCTGTLVASDIQNLAQCCDIPTNNNQLSNGCGYTTCTGTVVASDLTPYAKTCTLCTVATSGKYCDLTGQPTIPTDNCQLSNGCGYTTCTGTVVAGDLAVYAQTCTLCTVATSGKYCDLTGQPTIPTDNCQLANSCGYTTCTGTLSTCSDITTALGYTPYSSANPSGYTTCTGTLVASDIECLAQCCDIPTDNCQLSNSCGYTTCTGTLTADNISDSAFGSSWNSDTTHAPSKNAVYDVLGDVETLLAAL